MIIETNGQITILNADITLGPNLSKILLLESNFYKENISSVHDMKTGYEWFNFIPLDYLDTKFLISICFHHNNVYCINLTATGEEYPTSWGNYTEEGELKRKKKHDEILKRLFMRDPDVNISVPYPMTEYVLNWGKAISNYDPKSGSSLIILIYKINETAARP